MFYWTLPGSCLSKLHRFVDAENVLSWKFSSSRKFNLHVVYIFELAWNSLTLFYMQSIITLLFCENDLLIPVHLCVNVSAQIGYSGNFLTFLHPLIYCDFYILWYVICLKSHIEIKSIFLCHAIVWHFLINDTDVVK